MATTPYSAIPRSLLQEIAGKDFRLLKYLENLAPDLTAVTNTANNAYALATTAESDAQEALSQLGTILAAALKAQNRANEALESALAQRSAEVSKLRSHIRTLQSRIEALENAP